MTSIPYPPYLPNHARAMQRGYDWTVQGVAVRSIILLQHRVVLTCADGQQWSASRRDWERGRRVVQRV